MSGGGHLWLIGMMGSGKSVVGAAVAPRLGRPLVDTDTEVEALAGTTITDLFETDGEAAFRHLESVVISRVAAGPPAVVATGGGAVLDAHNVAAMRASGRIVWLSAAPDVLVKRLDGGAGRPLLGADVRPTLSRLLNRRRPLYAAIADTEVPTDGHGVQDVAAMIEVWWKES